MSTFSRLHLLLKDEGTPIRGEAVDVDFVDQIQLTSFKWDIRRKKNDGAQGARADRGRAEPGVFEIGKAMDRSSTAMLTKLKTSAKLSATITLSSVQYSQFELTATLTDVRLVDYSIKGKDGDKGGDVDEDWTLTYDTIRFEHAPGDDNATLTSTHKRSPDGPDTSSSTSTKAFLASFDKLGGTEKKAAATELKKKDEFK